MERDVGKFLAALASAAPAPGGGGAAALCGALAIALGNMVGNLTLGKKKYAGVQDDITALNARAESLRLDFLALIDADAAAFEPLSRAYGIPKDDPGRAEIMEAALLRAGHIRRRLRRGAGRGGGKVRRAERLHQHETHVRPRGCRPAKRRGEQPPAQLRPYRRRDLRRGLREACRWLRY